MLVRVLEIAKSTGEFCFHGGNIQIWKEVDWFDDNDPEKNEPMIRTQEGREKLAEFIKNKDYYNPEKAYLVLHPEHCFTIGYSEYYNYNAEELEEYYKEEEVLCSAKDKEDSDIIKDYLERIENLKEDIKKSDDK